MNKNINDLNQTSKTETPKTGVADQIGEAIEGVGHKVSDMGLPKVGQKIHDLGDKLEKTHDDPNHPHDV